MRESLVQLGVKGLHIQQAIQVRENRHGKESLEALDLLLVLPLPVPPTLSASTANELSVYMDSDNVTAYEDDFDLLLWWRDHKLTYTILSIMARDIMFVPVSTVSSESCFSLTGRIIEERRRHLLSGTVEILACIKDWELGESC